MKWKRCRFGPHLIFLGVLTITLARVLEAQSGQAWTKILEFAEEQIAQAAINFAIDQLKEYVASRSSPGTPEGNFQEALDYFRGTNSHGLDETKAVEYATRSANAGYSPAQDFLGDLCMRNLDYPGARKWYVEAAKYEAHAQFQLGNLAFSGRLGSPDYETALYWYRMAAGRRHSNAEYQVASILMTGQAHPPTGAEKAEAADDLEDAANQGLAVAQAALGYHYAMGIGRPQDYCKAVEWSRKAAERGSAIAASNLGIAYENGQCNGVVDRTLALRYYRQAASAGDAPSEASANRVQDTIRAELARLTAAPSSTPQRCFLRDGADFYDSNGDGVRPLFLRRSSFGTEIMVIANENNNEFVRTNMNGVDASGVVIGLFVRGASIFSCNFISSGR